MTTYSLDPDLIMNWEYMTPAERLACPERPDPMLIDIIYKMRRMTPEQKAKALRFADWVLFRDKVKKTWRKFLNLIKR